MKKFKIMSLLLTFVMLFTLNYGMVSAAPKSFKVKRSETLSDLVTNERYGFVVFTTDDGHFIYCMDNLKEPLATGMTAYEDGTADDGLLYILKNVYPEKEIMEDENHEQDKYLAQAAVWWYMDETKQGSNQLSDDFKNATTLDRYKIVPEVKKLVAAAKTYKDNQPKPELKVSVDSKELALTSDNKYYESQLISVNLVGAKTYNAIYNGGTKGTKIVDENGLVKTTFNANDKFKIRIPANELTEQTDITLQVSAKGVTEKAKIYKTDAKDKDYQRVVGLFDEETPLTQTINLKASPNTTTVEVEVPNTKADILMISIAIGVVIILAGVGIIIYRGRKVHKI